VNVPAEPFLRPRELAVSRRVLLSFQTNHAAKAFSCLLDERSISSGGSIKLCVNHLSQLSGSTIPLP
jgi:hypothetical protein